MGSRGASSGKGNAKTVPFDKWGKDITNGYENRKPIYDEKGNEVGAEFVEDRTAYVQVPFIQEATVSQVVRDINGWKNDDGTYGNEDAVMGVFYSNGDHITSQDDNFGRRFAKNKRDIVGAYISTGDYEAVAGQEYNGRARGWTAIETTSDLQGRSYNNAYFGYEVVGMYKVRTKTTYLEDTYAREHKKRTVTNEVIRRSAVKPIEIPKKSNRGYGKTILIDYDNPL